MLEPFRGSVGGHPEVMNVVPLVLLAAPLAAVIAGAAVAAAASALARDVAEIALEQIPVIAPELAHSD